MNRPHVLLKAAMSLDGFIDDASPVRRIFSCAEDAKAVDELRAQSDAVLVGAQTIRSDNPRLNVHSGRLRSKRRQYGRSPDVTKVTLTRSGKLDPRLNFFQVGKAEKIVYASEEKADGLVRDLYGLATIVPAVGREVALEFLLDDLYNRGIRRLLVEGGTSLLTEFIQQRLASELRIAVSPIFINDRKAPRIINDTLFSQQDYSFELYSVEKLGEMSILCYRLTPSAGRSMNVSASK